MNKATILIVEDSLTQAEQLKHILEQHSYTVEMANGGKQALVILSKQKLDLVITDIVMPEMQGYELCKHIKSDKNKRDIPVILLTSLTSTEDVLHGLACGADSFITKPYSEDYLISRIESILEDKILSKNLHQKLSVEIMLDGKKCLIDTEYHQILNLLISSYEAAVSKNTELVQAQDGLKLMNDQLEKLVQERTASLSAEIIQRKEVEKVLKKSVKEWQDTFDSTKDIITLISTEHRFIKVNKAMCKSLGKTQEEVVGKKCYEIVHGTDSPIKACPCIATLNIGSKGEAEIEEHGRKYLVTASPVFDDKNKLSSFVHIIKDITEHNRMEEEKDKLQNQLLQSQKMESIGTLAGGIAHDFNNLLTAIKGYADLSKASIDRENPLYNDLNEITLAADRATILTRQMLLFSRNQPMNLINLSLNRVIENMSKMLERIIGEDIEIQTILQSDSWNTLVDESRIEQIIMNLSVNARDAMPMGGILAVKTENVTLTEEHAKDIFDAYPGRFIRLSIQDNGAGMSNEVVQRIFEPFFTTKGIGKGTGLGLSVVYGIVKQHNGWINVYSEPSKGTIFKIYLPASSDSEIKEISEKKEVKYHGLKGRGERILVVEDEEGIRKIVDRALSSNGYIVFSARTVKEALEVYKTEKGDFNLVLSDVVLPDRTGLELIAQLLLDNPKIQVIFSSGYLDDKSQWEMIQEKEYKFLQKPFELNELLVAVKEVLGK
ncbi:MAG: response regulator [Elusimicrobiota bacterium]